MAGNIITIKFNEDLIDTGRLVLSGLMTSFGQPQSFDYGWNWKSLRDTLFTVTIGTPTQIAGERSAINFVQAFNMDVNSGGIYSVVRNVNTVVITAPNTTLSTITFDNAWALKSTSPIIGVNVTFTYGNVNTSNLTILGVEYSASLLDICGSVNVKVKANQIVTSVTSPVTMTPNAIEFTFSYPRGATGIINVQNGQGATATKNFNTPGLLSAGNFSVQVNNSPNGATIIVKRRLLFAIIGAGFTVEFALGQGNVLPHDYQSEATFSGIAPGDYTLYIKDQFGCIKTLSFKVDEIESSRYPYFYISKAMSIRFAERVVWDNKSIYKTDENTLSCEVDVPVVYKEIQQFQSNDIITTQFKSNFSINKAYVIKEDGSAIEIPVFQKSNNLKLKDKRQAVLINLGNGKNGVYFMSGQTYNYDTNAVTGDYNLNGALPVWAQLGTYFSINGAWYQIEDFNYDDSLGADILVFSGSYTGVPNTAAIVGAIYNLEEYEVFEFTVDFSSFLDLNINVKIASSDSEFGSIKLISESIEIKNVYEGSLCIAYSNPENNDVFYSTGITNILRLPYTKIGAKIEQSTDTYKTDTDTKLLSAELYEADEFIFEPVTKEIFRKIAIALSHKNVVINGISYVKSSEIDADGPLELSNLYVPKITMLKAKGTYSTDGRGIEIQDGSVDIPKLISTGQGYLRRI